MKKYFLAILIFLIFISGAVAVFFYFKDVLREAKGFEIIIDEVVSEPQLIEESFFEKLEPTLEINKEELFIKILNGTGIRGEASKFAQELEGAGFKISVVANADSFDYQKTLIKYKIGKEREAELINQSLNYLGQLVEEENQEEDIIIIIGND